jgi:hypothetical protein
MRFEVTSEEAPAYRYRSTLTCGLGSTWRSKATNAALMLALLVVLAFTVWVSQVDKLPWLESLACGQACHSEGNHPEPSMA